MHFYTSCKNTYINSLRKSFCDVSGVLLRSFGMNITRRNKRDTGHIPELWTFIYISCSSGFFFQNICKGDSDSLPIDLGKKNNFFLTAEGYAAKYIFKMDMRKYLL